MTGFSRRSRHRQATPLVSAPSLRSSKKGLSKSQPLLPYKWRNKFSSARLKAGRSDFTHAITRHTRCADSKHPAAGGSFKIATVEESSSKLPSVIGKRTKRGKGRV